MNLYEYAAQLREAVYGDYTAALREAIGEAEANDDGQGPDPRFAAGYAMGLRVAAALAGMPEGADPATRARRRGELVSEEVPEMPVPSRPSMGTFNVTMLDVLHGPFMQWLASRGLVLAQPPGLEDASAYVVVPAVMRAAVEER